MGGFGSGRYDRWGKRATTDEYHRLDVRDFHRGGWLVAGKMGTLRWERGGRPAGSIGWAVRGDAGRATDLELLYRVGDEEIAELVPLEWTPCHYGGERPWLRCPGFRCGRRVAILYGGRRFRCRHCHRLTYASTRADAVDRPRRRAQRIRMKLGGTVNLQAPFPSKPPRMHWRTYWRLYDEAAAAEAAYTAALLTMLERTSARLERLIGRPLE